MSVLPAREGYRLWAATYGPETAVSLLEARLVEEMGPATAGLRLLDAGCGTARRLRAAGAVLAAGADLAPEMLAAAPSPRGLAAADVRALPYRAGAFDLVWCRLVVGHLPTVEEAYGELARVCRAGGAVVVTDLHPEAAAAGHRRTFRDAGGALHEVEHHLHPLERHRAAAAAAGLAPAARRDGRVDAALRPLYARAGRLAAYEAQQGLALVLALAFRRA